MASDYSDLLTILLDPVIESRAKIQAFDLLEATWDRGWAIMPALIKACWSEDAAQRDRARWALWCTQGPRGYHEMLKLGPRPARMKLLEAFDRANWPDYRGALPRVLVIREDEEFRPDVQALTEWYDKCVRSDLPEFRRRGVEFFMHELKVMGGRPTSSYFIASLAEVWDADQEQRPEIWKAVLSIGFSRLPCTPIVLRAWKEPRYQQSITTLMRFHSFEPDYIAYYAMGQPHLSNEAKELLDRSGNWATDRAIRYLAYLAADRRSDADILLDRWKAENLPVVKVARVIALIPGAERQRFRGLLDPERSPDRQARELLQMGEAGNHPKLAEVLAKGRELFKLDRIDSASPEAIRYLPADLKDTSKLILDAIKSPEVKYRRAGMTAVAKSATPLPELRQAAVEFVRDPDDEVRNLAARIARTEEARQVAQVPVILRDLAAESKAQRMSAARRLESLGLEKPQVSAALIRATDRGDFAVREGLVVAMHRAWAARRDTVEVLKEMAENDPDTTLRTYAKAGLREIAAK